MARAHLGASDWSIGPTTARLSSSLPRPASVDISVASFQWQHFGGNILCRRLVVPPCRRRVVVLVASSSSPRRRPRRFVVVVTASSSASSSSSSSSSSQSRLVVAASSPSSSSSCRRRVVSSLRRVIRPRLYPHPRPSPPVLVVALSCVRLYPTAILPPPALTTSAGRRVVSSVPASIITAILTGILTAILAPDPHHLTRSDCEAATAASVRACTLHRGWGAAGSCSECELRAAEGSSDCEGTWGLQAVVVEGSSWPCRRVPASARLGGNISVATFGPCRCVVASSSRRVVDASSSPRRRHVVVVVASSSRRVVAASLSVPASILTGIPTVVVAVAVVAVSSVPASILTSPPGPVVWVRSEEGKQCSDCGADRAPAKLQRL